MNLVPVIIEESQSELKYGDVFKVSPDSSPSHLLVPKEFVRDNVFIAVPHNYESWSLSKVWKQRIKEAEKKYLPKK